MDQDDFGTDLQLDFLSNRADLSGSQGLSKVSGVDNLVQALTLRLMLDKGELSVLGHPRYGSQIRDFLGEPLDRANRELIRRYVRKTLLEDDRVEEVLEIKVRHKDERQDSIQVSAQVQAVRVEMPLNIEVTINVG